MESDEEFLHDDIVEGKRVRALHRNDVKLQYDSDLSLSDYENPDKNGNEKDDDDDMFASEDEKVEKTDKKKVDLLDMNEFEKALGVESSVYEEEAWMNSNGAETRRAKRAQKLREKNEQRARRQKLEDFRDIAENLRILVQFLEPTETPLEALARLAPKKKGKSISEEETLRKEMVFDITEACDRLTNDNDIDDVYDKSREELMRLYSRETGQELEPRGIKRLREEEDSQEWEFRWKGEDIVNGPYTVQQMAEWVEHYFNGDVMVRRVGENEFVDVNEVR